MYILSFRKHVLYTHSLQSRESADAGVGLVCGQLDRNLSIYMYKTGKPHQFYNYKNVYISQPYRLLLYMNNNWKKKKDMDLLKYHQLLISHRWLL